MLSALIGNFANKVACFSRIVLHPIAKGHVKPWSVSFHLSEFFFYPLLGRARFRAGVQVLRSHSVVSSSRTVRRAVHGEVDRLDIGG